MVSGFISRLVILIFGTLYPAYASYKAVRTKNVKEYVKWMMYWIVFALFTCAETFTDLFLSFWFPFYYEIKIITVIYLLSPATKGSSILYRKFVHPVLTKREQEIDEYIAKAKEQGYHTMLNLGSKGVNYATSLIMQTAIKGLPNLPLTPSSDFLPTKSSDVADIFDLEEDCSIIKDLSENFMGQGGGGLVNQLRKSYSLSDLREDQNGTVTDGGGPKCMPRSQTQFAGQTAGSYNYFYSAEDDSFRQTTDSKGRTVYPEDLSSGYSSADPLNYDTRASKGEILARTASLGSSSRIRTRAVTKNGLPKRASLSEGGSSWSPLESHESQNETDNSNNSLSHSASYPFPLAPFYPYFFSNYPYTFRSDKILATLDHFQYSQNMNDHTFDFQNAFEGLLECKSVENLRRNPIIVFEENSNNSVEINSEEDLSDGFVTNKLEIYDNKNYMVDSASQKIKAKEERSSEKKIKVMDTEKKIVTRKQNLLLSNNEGLNYKKKPFQERLKGYNKKRAPAPPVEDFALKSSSNHAIEGEESEFFTPNTSPEPCRKQSISPALLIPTDKNDSLGSSNTAPPETVTQTVALVEAPKKTRTKKGDFKISKKLHMPKIPFSFWHQKAIKQPINSETSSTVSVETSSIESESQSNNEIFIPLKDCERN